MKINKLDFIYILSTITVLLVSFIMKDTPLAIIASICGMAYTILIGKRKPEGYIFGIIGTISGSILSFNIALWGNFLLHAFYFLPMEIVGLFCWKKNFNKEENTVSIEKLSKKEIFIISFIGIFLFTILSILFIKTNDVFPYIDSIITTLSLIGMYLTVKRCYEQWILWTVVNSLSVLMWFEIYSSGIKVISVLIVRVIYLLLGIHFFIKWYKNTK